MRPEILELEGFTAFRQKTRVEFGDADLFAFTGPTGAGKSSLIDAMIFALYGKVPRLGERLVEPVITKGRQEARVRLDFTLGDDRYTAVRVVRRTKSGATTKEARLERGDEVLAGNATSLDPEIRRLLGLDFQQFTTCVALPQGEFARFLRQAPRDRQALLSKLLGLGVYGRVRDRARGRKDKAVGRIELLESQLAGLSEADEAAEADRERRVETLAQLQTQAREESKRQAEWESEQRAVAEERRRGKAQMDALAAADTPRAVRDLGAERREAEECRRAAQDALARAEADRKAAGAERSRLGDAVALSRVRDDWVRRDRLVGRREAAARDAEGTEAALRAAEERSDDAEAEVSAARETLAGAERTYRAHSLRGGLVVGEPCPVCEQEVCELPSVGEAAGLDGLGAAVRKAERAERSARQRRDEAARAHAAAEQKRKSANEEYEEVTATLAGRLGRPEAERALAAIAKADGVVEQAEARLERERKALRTAEEEVGGFDAREKKAWSRFDAARDRLSDLEPPAPDRSSLISAWEALERWAAETLPEVRASVERHDEKARRLDEERTASRERLAHFFSECGVALRGDPQRAADTALEGARRDLAEVRRQRKERRRLQSESKAAREAAAVAGALHTHLRADRFERWLLTAAFHGLTADASRILVELSGGQYSFRHNEKFEFDIVDHGNADETRSSKTLSGGETFLASLALALALSDQISELAAAGAARLESIFLDEGFGSLDADTLDTVAATIEELGAKGRTVGLVTHVRDLAERIPVQFRVSKTSATASVERIAS